jgi:hypothetical protein
MFYNQKIKLLVDSLMNIYSNLHHSYQDKKMLSTANFIQIFIPLLQFIKKLLYQIQFIMAYLVCYKFEWIYLGLNYDKDI